MASMREELAELLRQNSLTTGEFRLASGKPSSVYVDCKRTVLTARGAFLAGELLWGLIQQLPTRPSGVGGLTLGADPLLTSISLAAHRTGSPIDAIIVRKQAKQHGTQRFLELPPTLIDGDEIIAVDDVITTGGSTLDAISKIRDAGYVVRHAICLVDREDVGRAALADQGVELHPLFSLSALVESRGSH